MGYDCVHAIAIGTATTMAYDAATGKDQRLFGEDKSHLERTRKDGKRTEIALSNQISSMNWKKATASGSYLVVYQRHGFRKFGFAVFSIAEAQLSNSKTLSFLNGLVLV